MHACHAICIAAVAVVTVSHTHDLFSRIRRLRRWRIELNHFFYFVWRRLCVVSLCHVLVYVIIMIVLRSCMLFPFLSLAYALVLSPVHSLARSLSFSFFSALHRSLAVYFSTGGTLRAASINRFDDCPQHQRQHYNQTVIWPLLEPSVSIQNVPEQHVCSLVTRVWIEINFLRCRPSISKRNILTYKCRIIDIHGLRETHISHSRNHLFPKKEKKRPNRCKTVSIEIELKIACETF